MNEEYIQQPVTDVAENTDAQTVEENEEGIELTDTTSNQEGKESVKTYTEEDLERLVNERVNEILPNKIEREKRKIEKTYRDKLSNYEETESILSTALKTQGITEINKQMRELYKEQGIDIPAFQKPKYSDEDEKDLGELAANKIIKLGFDEMQEEANQLADIGTDNMTVRQKAMFAKLVNELTYQKQIKELAKIGVKKEILEEPNFKEFSSQFNSGTPIDKIYNLYAKTHETQKKVEQIGSMKSNKTTSEVKEYYTPEEASRFTKKDYDKNPKLLEAVEKSMTLWMKK